ncbi:MAG: hypothetical protein MHM6MM_009274 [Cercozoa sp. M6MM]
MELIRRLKRWKDHLDYYVGNRVKSARSLVRWLPSLAGTRPFQEAQIPLPGQYLRQCSQGVRPTPEAHVRMECFLPMIGLRTNLRGASGSSTAARVLGVLGDDGRRRRYVLQRAFREGETESVAIRTAVRHE